MAEVTVTSLAEVDVEQSEQPLVRPGARLSKPPRLFRHSTQAMDRVLGGISSSINALPGMAIPAWLLCAPLVFGNLWLVTCWVAGADFDGFINLPGFLCQKVLWVDLYNYWMIAVMGGVPFFISLLAYATIVYDCEMVAREVAATIGLDSLDAHTTLVQKGRRIMPLDLFMLFLYFASVTLTLFLQMIPKRFLVFWVVPQLGTGIFMGLCSAFCACALPFVLRDVRVGLLRREGSSILTHLDAAKVKFLLVLTLSCVCFLYICVLASSSVPFTRSMTRLDEPNGNPCTIARNATYIQTRCRLSTAIHGPRYICDDGGWEEYSSAEVGCHAAQLYYSVVAKLYSAFGMWLNGFGWAAWSEVEHAIDSKPKFPGVQLLARLMIHVTVLVLGPTYLAIIIAPSDELVPNSWVTMLVHDLWAAFINIGAWLVLLALINFELIMRQFDALLSGSALSVVDPAGTKVDLREEISRLLQPKLVAAREQGSLDTANGDGAGRFTLEPHDLVSGHPKEAALGVNYYMKVSPRFSLPPAVDAIRAVRAEFEQFGTAVDKECLDYVLFQRAGTSERMFANGNLRRDCDAQGNTLPSRLGPDGLGKSFEDFCADPRAQILGKLQPAHVLALRVYTTAAFISLNSPLRSTSPDRPPHPFPVTINLIKEGIGQLRAVDAEGDDAHAPRDLWRGLKNLRAQDNFLRGGGTELAPMSTTTDLGVALAYSMSASSLLFKVHTKSFLQRGADLTFLSAFPAEAEILFPPLTFLRPTGKKLTVDFQGAGVKFTVVEVEPIQ